MWYDKEPLYSSNTHCPICGKDLSESDMLYGPGGGFLNKITTCSEQCTDEFLRKVWALGHAKDKPLETPLEAV